MLDNTKASRPYGDPTPAPLAPARRFTAARRAQSVFAVIAALVVGFGANKAGLFTAEAPAPQRTLAAAMLTAPASRIAPEALNAAPAALPPSVAEPVVAAPARDAAPASVPARTVSVEAPAAPAALRAVATDTDESGAFFQDGMASYYGRELAGRRTASGERFNPNDLTAAHRTLPLGTRIRVTNPANGDAVVVRVNDRGPFHGNRVLDLSHQAARVIGIAQRGTGRILIEVLGRVRGARKAAREDAPRAVPSAPEPEAAAPAAEPATPESLAPVAPSIEPMPAPVLPDSTGGR